MDGLHKADISEIKTTEDIDCSACGKTIKNGEDAVMSIVEGAYYRNFITDFYHKRCYK